MPEESRSAHPVRFGVFELDRRSGELRKAGVRVNLQEQGLQVLTLLLERPGDLVTRDELRQRLWPTGTFGDLDHGLNAVINRLRETLGDSADSPRFIETLPRRGYRFVGPIEPDSRALPAVEAEAVSVPQKPSGRPFLRRPAVPIMAALALCLLAAVAGALWHLWRTSSVERPAPRLVVITRLAGDEDWPAFSPDGEQVAFSWSGEKFDNTDIYVTLVGATEIRRLTTDPAEDYAPSWSPDGRHIAFLRTVGRTARIHITSPLGGTDLKLSDFPVRVAPWARISWSPDSRFVVAGLDEESAAGVPAGIYLIPLDGGEPRTMTRPTGPSRDSSPAFSPDGRHLAYVSCGTDCDVRVVDVDTTFAASSGVRTLTPKMAFIGTVTWSRDGRSILFYRSELGVGSVWRTAAEGNGLERVELGESAWHPATVASRDRLAFSRRGGESVRLYRFDAALPDERIAPSSSWEISPHFSPDGRRLAFSSGRSGAFEIWVAAADGSSAEQLTHRPWVQGGAPSWAPDGQTIAFHAQDQSDKRFHLWTVDADGGASHQLTQGADDQMAPTWSRDGQWIYFSARPGQGQRLDIWRVRMAGGQPEQVTRTGSGHLAIESVSADSLLYQPKPEDSALLLQPLSGGRPRQLVACARTDAFATAGHVVFYAACEPGWNPSLHTIDMATGQDRILGRLEHFPPMSATSLAVSPDGKTVVYEGVVHVDSDLMMIENFH
jgi:Tol biopolymer transport system component/DNA-binding winged helix-turn-helix (wHTH) protein